MCRLKVRYFQDPKTFKRAVLGQYRKGVKRATNTSTRSDDMEDLPDRGADTRYMTCQPKADRARLTVAFQQIEKPVTRGRHFEMLKHLFVERTLSCRSSNAVPVLEDGKSLQTQ